MNSSIVSISTSTLVPLPSPFLWTPALASSLVSLLPILHHSPLSRQRVGCFKLHDQSPTFSASSSSMDFLWYPEWNPDPSPLLTRPCRVCPNPLLQPHSWSCAGGGAVKPSVCPSRLSQTLEHPHPSTIYVFLLFNFWKNWTICRGYIWGS